MAGNTWEQQQTPGYEALQQQSETRYIGDLSLHILLAEARECTALLDILFEHSPLGIAFWNKNHQFVRVNDSFSEITGMSKESHLQKNIKEIAPGISDQIDSSLNAIFEQGRPIIAQQVLGETSASKGKVKSLVLSYYPLAVEDQVLGVAAICEEVTEKILIADKLKFLGVVSQSISDPVISTNLNFKVKSWNQAAVDLYGYTAAEVIGRDFYDVVPTDFLDNSLEEYKSALLEDGSWKGEVIQINKSGKQLAIQVSNSVLRNSKGKAVGYVTINRDITKAKIAERQKDEFMAIASHELLTPITSVKAYGQYLEKRFSDSTDERSKELMAKMVTQLDKLTLLVNDLLDVSKIDNGEMEFHFQQINYNDLLKEVAIEAQRLSKNHKLDLQIQTDQDIMINADCERLRQVLFNLISNAIKYSPQADRVLIKVTQQEGLVKTEVIDFGIGIAPKQQAQIFQRFYKVDLPESESYAGLGIGLFICREIINGHKGEIFVSSSDHQGSNFYFTLPTN